MDRDAILGKRIEEFHSDPILEHVLDQISSFRNKTFREAKIIQRQLGKAEVMLRLQPIYQDDKYDGILLNVIDVTEHFETRRYAEIDSKAKRNA